MNEMNVAVLRFFTPGSPCGPTPRPAIAPPPTAFAGAPIAPASSNSIGFTTAFSGSTQTAIIAPATYRFATLVSDGTNWIIMQRNN